MLRRLILPISTELCDDEWEVADNDTVNRVNCWMDERIEFIRRVFLAPDLAHDKPILENSSALAGELIRILTHRVFNYQSKKSIQELLPAVKVNLLDQLQREKPIQLLYLYNGGYRASLVSNNSMLVFEPDQTELMLMYQIALLKEKISKVYPQGIEFTIVINNGVAHWVNNIPLDSTCKYAQQFRNMIEYLGADKYVRVLLQSELDSYNNQYDFSNIETQTEITEKEHAIINRFKGCDISREDAQLLAARYTQAESDWFKVLTATTIGRRALLMRQVASEIMLSFRPFPGGAIRAQNGSLGFEVNGDSITPKLITSENGLVNRLQVVPLSWPWQCVIT
jgi:hypothetical protein